MDDRYFNLKDYDPERQAELLRQLETIVAETSLAIDRRLHPRVDPSFRAENV
jgi:hypothetical protein